MDIYIFLYILKYQINLILAALGLPIKTENESETQDEAVLSLKFQKCKGKGDSIIGKRVDVSETP